MLEVGRVEVAGADDRLPSERAEVAALRRQVAELTARVRTAERRAELLESSRRTLLAVAWGGRTPERP